MRPQRQVEMPIFASAVAEAVGCYNAAAARCGWPAVQKMTPARRTALNGRLHDCGGLDGWTHAVARAEASDFICGRTNRSLCGTA